MIQYNRNVAFNPIDAITVFIVHMHNERYRETIVAQTKIHM